MSTEVQEETALAIPSDLHITRAPKEILDSAIEAATSLQNVISKKKRKVAFNGEQYLQFEDWQTVGGFFGVSVATGDAELVQIDGVPGFKAKARVIDSNGIEVSAAEAYCMKDEPNWRGKPFFQLASMAQTRAGAKALRNKFAWVAVLAGYSPTPAEEMTHTDSDAAEGFPGDERKAAPASDVPPCPKCSGPVWDNRVNKRNPRSPDFKCKDKSCDGVIWKETKKDVESTMVKQSIVDAMKVLNQAGDSIVWTPGVANDWVAERFDGHVIDELKTDECQKLLKMLSDRLDGLKAPDKNPDRRGDIIASIKSNFMTIDLLQSYLDSHWGSMKLEEMNVSQLEEVDRDVSIPF